MKTKLLIPILLLVTFNLIASSNDEPGFVITDHDTTICKKVSLGLTNARIELNNGSVLKVRKNQILAFKNEGRHFERKTLFENNKPTNRKVLMELIAQRNGLKLYSYRYSETTVPQPSIGNSESNYNPVLLLVYRDDDFYLQVTKFNAPILLDFFHVNGAIFE